ncbi:hypothetical protein [Chryseobacterium sp. 2987]|uniref:hypothetical protein n=1 Tax=Chryseobacterium sp. 2987 TaxID=2817767 RepID=UPI0028631C3B|nr:hypothetical protein [Chryseobacterium sp. 2987]MDR6923637.1 hypothetical protein [Chryseobacterium sp. 2987]
MMITSSVSVFIAISFWNTGNNTYTIPDTGVIEYSTNISNSPNGDGTSKMKEKTK